jgi:hypothetical protein
MVLFRWLSCLASSKPIPLVPPVIKMVFPESFMLPSAFLSTAIAHDRWLQYLNDCSNINPKN